MKTAKYRQKGKQVLAGNRELNNREIHFPVLAVIQDTRRAEQTPMGRSAVGIKKCF